MGDYGSGRWRNHQTKTRVEDCHVLDAARWQREGILEEGCLSERAPLFGVAYHVDATDMSCPHVHLVYMIERQRFEYPVDLQTTRPHLGGLRWWFVCPLCQGRAQKLFLPPDADRFGCRTCHKLSYASSSERPFDRYIARARKIQLRLGGSASLLDPFPAKPKGMWWRTYRRHVRFVLAEDAAMLRVLLAVRETVSPGQKKRKPNPA